MKLSLEEGEKLVKFARSVVEEKLGVRKVEISKDFKKRFSEKRGAFVTIKEYLSNRLRGCIGIPNPIYPLWKAVEYSAKAAAFEDPRFPPLNKEEVKNIIFEISILTKPELILVKNPKEYLNKIEIGKDGLIIEYGPYSGLLLPQVPVEEGWDVIEFLSYLCLKAGLPPDFWTNPNVKIYKFQAQVFKEKEPRGEVVEEKF